MKKPVCCLLAGLTLAGCVATPWGPTVQVMPGPRKSLADFQSDDFGCRQFATNQVAGQAQAANNAAVGGAVVGTAIGAGLGAAIGGGRGAAIGAASGAGLGTAYGADSSAYQQAGIQMQYDNAYSQCMYSRGNQVPGYAPTPAATYATSRALVRAVQVQLMRLGYMRGPADGLPGPATSNAISAYEAAHGLPLDGAPSDVLLAQLQSTPSGY